MDPVAVLALCHEHAAAEASFDIDRVLATLVPEPRFEFFPLASALDGREAIEDFYRHRYGTFAAAVTGFVLLGEWANDDAALQEYVIDVRHGDGTSGSYRVMSMMPVDQASGLLTGERLYCDVGFVEALLGPLMALLAPMPAA